MSGTKEKSKKPGCYLVTAFWLLIFIVIVKWIRPNAIPFSLFQFWHFQGSVLDMLTNSWPVFAFGLLLNLASLIYNRKQFRIEYIIEEIFGGSSLKKDLLKGIVSSFIAGIFEEIAFRWILFYSAIVWLEIANVLLLGFPHWIVTVVEVPSVNFLTLGILAPLMTHSSWFVGGAIINANGEFQKGHKYLYQGHKKITRFILGFIGYLASWFIGWFLYYLMFKYGILASILVHLLYDVMITIFMFISMSIHKKMSERNRH